MQPQHNVGDLVTDGLKPGLVIAVKRSNMNPLADNASSDLHPFVYYALFDSGVDGPLFSDELYDLC